MMTNKALITFILCLLFSASYAQKKEKIKGNRTVTIIESKINSFNRILVGENFEVDLIEGSEASVFIETDDNLHDVIRFNVADSVLSFNSSKQITTFKKMSIKVTYTTTLKEIETVDDGQISSLTSLDLDEISLKHSGTSKAYLNIKCSKLKLINTDRARVKLNVTATEAMAELNDNSKTEALIKADSLNVDLYQRANAKLEGDLRFLQVRAENTSSFNGRNLTSINATVESDLNSNVYINATESLIIDAKGNSEVYVYNTPEITLNTFTGNSKLHKKELKKK